MFWNLFFTLTGFMSLLYWNSALNLTQFFTYHINQNIFTYYNFAVSFGGLLAFLIGPIIFESFTNYLTILLCFSVSGFLFYVNLTLVTLEFALGLKILLTTIMFLLVGFLITVV